MASVLEASSWQMRSSGPEAYERYIVPAWMGDWAQDLVTAAGLVPGQRVLDIACGTGIVARKAVAQVGPAGTVTGFDADRDMKVVEMLADNYRVALLNSKNAWRILGQESYAFEVAQWFGWDTYRKCVFVPIGNAGNITAIMADIRRQAAQEAVARHGGNRNAACRELAISKDTLRRILGRQDADA